MNRSKSKHIQDEAEIRKKIIENTMVYNDVYSSSYKNIADSSPVALLKTYQKQTPVQELKHQTQRNMKFKLDQLQDKLGQLSSEVHSARQQYRELIDFTTRAKSNLVYEELFGLKSELQGKIMGLSNQLRLGRQAADQRYGEIRKECSQIWGKTEQLRQNVFSLTMRIEALQEKMGFKQIYRLQYL